MPNEGYQRNFWMIPVFVGCLCIINTVKPVLRGHIKDKEKVTLQDRWPLKRGSIDMKFSMIVEEKGDLLIQVTA